ncbi:sorting nexin-20 [Octopus vulgaris]|uniref:Sorting nexin-20 n=1 Tax=Octopus vulgaris TaxID=6645 RepID=A0A9Y1D1G8_OCTVU|nr:sorting nexin-20 [Octopus vulgaris]CAJ1099383.1 sorting nexin-20 [Octopus vulgaris]
MASLLRKSFINQYLDKETNKSDSERSNSFIAATDADSATGRCSPQPSPFRSHLAPTISIPTSSPTQTSPLPGLSPVLTPNDNHQMRWHWSPNSPCQTVNEPLFMSDQEELASLADEMDDDNFANLGTLSFSEDEEARNSATDIVKTEPASYPDRVPFDGQYYGNERVNFEVTSADKVKQGRSSFVMYTVLISKNSGIDKMPTMIEKRYSDFAKLHHRLKKKIPHKMEDIFFPKKLLTGNFTSETIARRSRAFEQYLTHIFSISEIRYSEEFANFFYLKELQTAYSLINDHKYSQAIPLMEKYLPIQEKVHSDAHPDVMLTLCAIAACYHQLDRPYMAHRYAETALNCMQNFDIVDNTIYVALLQLSIRVCWTLGKDKRNMEAQLQNLHKQGIVTENTCSLMDIVKSRIRKSY